MRELVTLIRPRGNIVEAEETEDEEEKKPREHTNGTFTWQCVENAHARELASLHTREAFVAAARRDRH